MIVERLSWPLEQAFERFLAGLARHGDDAFFHPHGFTKAAAREVISLAVEGIDEYWVGLEDVAVVAYGMLRGWREGYEVPSLGVAVAANRRGCGLGKSMIEHLHAVARTRGATRVRLTVERHNTRATALYESLGYRFQDECGATRVGFFELANRFV